jgi:hypothetical protein
MVRRPEAGFLEEIHQIRVLRESEDPGEHGVRAQEAAGKEVVSARGEGKPEGEAQCVMAKGVADIEPSLGAVRVVELAAEDAGYHHHGGNAGIIGRRSEEPGVEAAPRSEGVGQNGPCSSGQ